MDRNYDDIINLPHFESKKHKRMTIEARSAQFAPFSALTGYEEALKESSRLTDKKIEIDEGLKQILNDKLKYILDNNINTKIIFKYFIKDERKNGGKYVEKKGVIKQIDNTNGYIILQDKTKIKIEDIIDITSNIFNEIEEYYDYM